MTVRVNWEVCSRAIISVQQNMFKTILLGPGVGIES